MIIINTQYTVILQGFDPDSDRTSQLTSTMNKLKTDPRNITTIVIGFYSNISDGTISLLSTDTNLTKKVDHPYDLNYSILAWLLSKLCL